jgi:putative transposase
MMSPGGVRLGGVRLQAYRKQILQKQSASAAEVTVTIPYRGRTSSTTYFVTSGTYCKKNLLQSDRMAALFCRTLFRYRDEGKFLLHAFVVMPNHTHLLWTVPQGLTLERAMQFIKGGFSHEAGKLIGSCEPIWQKSFVDRRVRDATECARFIAYIHQNPVRAGLVSSAMEFGYSSLNSHFRLDELPQRLKPSQLATSKCTAEAVLHPRRPIP